MVSLAASYADIEFGWAASFFLLECGIDKALGLDFLCAFVNSVADAVNVRNRVLANTFLQGMLKSVMVRMCMNR